MNAKRQLLALTASLALAGFSSFANAQEIYIPLISKGFQHQFWQAVKSGADKAAAELGVEVTFEGPDNETMVDKQIDMLNAAIAKKPAGIGFAALDSQAQVPLLQKAVDAGGRTYNQPQDHDFMYAHGFQDLDGHVWELLYMEMLQASV